VNKPRKDHNVKGEKYDVTIKPKKVKRNQSQLILDVVRESQKKYRESKTIEIDPEYIIEEQKKRQPYPSKNNYLLFIFLVLKAYSQVNFGIKEAMSRFMILP